MCGVERKEIIQLAKTKGSNGSARGAGAHIFAWLGAQHKGAARARRGLFILLGHWHVAAREPASVAVGARGPVPVALELAPCHRGVRREAGCQLTARRDRGCENAECLGTHLGRTGRPWPSDAGRGGSGARRRRRTGMVGLRTLPGGIKIEGSRSGRETRTETGGEDDEEGPERHGGRVLRSRGVPMIDDDDVLR